MALPSALLLAVLPSLLGAAPVTLHFAWPAKLKGSVKHAYSRRSEPGLGPSKMEASVEFRFSVQDAPGGLRKMVPSDVRYAQPTDPMLVGEPGIVLFDNQGAFKGIEHTKGDLLDRMTSGSPLPLPPEKQKEIRDQVETIYLSEAREKWDELTGRWNGVTLTPGTPSRRTVKLGIGSLLGHTEVDAVEVTTIETGVACKASALEKSCVRLKVDTNPAKPLERKKQKDPFGMVEINVTKRVVIVLEPATLVPHSIHLERADLVEREDPSNPKAKPETERHLQLDDMTFDYSPRGAQKL